MNSWQTQVTSDQSVHEELSVFDFVGGKHLEVLITPNILKSDKSLETIQPVDRSCYLGGERKLRFFKIYTKRNCEIECFSKYHREACNCVPFSVIRGSETRVCGISNEDITCSHLFGANFSDFGPTGMLASCSCLSPCDSVSYNIEIRDSKLHKNE